MKKSTGSSQREKLVRMSADAMKKPLIKAQKREVDALLAKPDSQIDFSDAPETTGLFRPLKRAVSCRIDADVMAWLRSQGEGHLTRINDILREKMLASSSGKSTR